MLATSASAEAARAAVAAAAAPGVTGVEPAILADGSNVIVHLAPGAPRCRRCTAMPAPGT